jgi:hypothetical protein
MNPGRRQECHPCKIHFSTNRRSRSFKLERGEIEAHMQKESRYRAGPSALMCSQQADQVNSITLLLPVKINCGELFCKL